MTNKEAVALAKAYVSELFADDGAINIGLEELRFDPEDDRWRVTIGFSRAWEEPQAASRWALTDDRPSRPRTFKTVEIDDKSGEVIDLRHWPAAA